MNNVKRALLIVATLLATGCTKEVGRVDFADAGTNGSYAPVPGGHLDVWAKVDISFEDDVSAGYRVSLLESGKEIATSDCNPFDVTVKMGEMKTQFGKRQRLRYSGKTKCSFDVPPGSYDVVAQLVLPNRPASLEVRHLDLVFKQ